VEREAVERFGGKKGDLTRAVEEAVKRRGRQRKINI
jgi:hypothetical protein